MFVRKIDNRITLIRAKNEKEALAPELPAIRKGRDREIDRLKTRSRCTFSRR